MYKKMPLWKKILTVTAGILLSLVLLLGAVMEVYIHIYYHSTQSYEEYASDSDQADSGFQITRSGSIIIVEPTEPGDTGIIFYPGAKVEYTAYIPLMEKLAQQGITCYIHRMPGNLAFFGVNKANDILNAADDSFVGKTSAGIKNWYIMGHSLGGAMASSFAARNSDELTGIIFLGAYPAYDLTGTDLKMLSIIGSLDGVLNRENYEKNMNLAPGAAEYEVIDGGNHGYFGDYGEQKGDGTATITHEEQWQKTADLIAAFCSK